jgi:hypothetical protein
MAQVQVIKLSTGEDIIGSVEFMDVPGSGKMVMIERPCIILLRPKEQNPKEFGLGLAPYCPYAKGFKFTIVNTHIVSIFEPEETLLSEYTKRYGSLVPTSVRQVLQE